MNGSYQDTTRTSAGFTMRSFLGILVVFAFLAAILMRLVPVYIEYFNVKSSLGRLASEPGLGKASGRRLKDRLMRQFDINNIANVKREDIKIAKHGRKKTVIVDYEVRRPLVANIDMIIHFHDQVALP